MPRIMIADDEWVTRVEIEEMLTDLGYEVVGQAETGAEAIDMARSLEPDLIVMDVMMPGEMNGIDAARVIKSELGTPIIFITGYGDPEYIEAAKEIAPFGYVMKPFDEKEIHASVEIALSKRELELKLMKAHEGLEHANLILQEEIASRKKTEKALRESERLYRDIFEKNKAIKWVLDPSTGKIIDANSAACEFYQYSYEEMTKLYLWDINLLGEAEIKKFLASAELDEQTEFTFKHRKASGEIRTVQIYTGTFESGGKRLLHSIIVDITDRKEAEEALRKSEEKYRLLADNISDNIWILDLGTLSFSYVSPSVVGITGYTAQEATGLQLQDTLTPASLELATKILTEELLREKQNADPSRSRTLELEQYRKDRSTIWTEVSMRFIRDAEGRPFSILGVTRDVTERKKAEAALKESESNLQSVFDAVPVGICFMKDRVYQRANKNWCDSFGYPEESLIGKTPEFLYESRAEYERVGKKLYGDLLEHEIASVHTRLKRSDGVICDVVLIAKPLDFQDLKGGAVTVVHDITERKRVEEEKKRLEGQLQQAHKMEAIGTLAGGIAHDFNNLLMGIQGRTSIMLMDKNSSHPDFEHLRGIESYVGSAADLTKQLLGFARGGKYEVKPTDLNELIRKESRMFGRTKKEITIYEKYKADLWSVEIDRGQIQQVLLNLYVNAWQAMPEGGSLYVETNNVILDENYLRPFSVKPGRYVKLSITDTGIGMDKATQERIFEPFFTTKEMRRGTGLGLASAYGIIKNHGGFINVYSEKSHGSTFSIYLPASGNEVIEEKKPARETLRGVETVLFVDDEDMITETAESLLELLGYKALTAGSGKEAIRIYEANKERIDLVILDMIMPDMSGGETYNRMKLINPKVKVILASGYNIDGQATKILGRGCNGFIHKPFSIDELSQKLREILDEE